MALVVTIVVLLILAGITINFILGPNSIFEMARRAGEETNRAVENEQSAMGNLINYIKDQGWESNSGESPDEPAIPDGLEIGSTISYNPSGTYKWQAAYCSSTKTPGTDTKLNDDIVLNSTEANFNISTWKVLSIDEKTGKVELVPSSPTTGTVYLGQAQGYNNAVKLLNDACRDLYGNTAKGITARSIKIEDIEGLMTEEALEGENGAHKYVHTGNIKYGDQVSSAYTSNKKYPVIYAQEKLSVINGTTKETGLDLSDEPSDFIERSEGTSTSSNIGAITTATSIQPYQTYWYKDATFMQTAFKSYKGDNSYYSLIMPNGTSTEYWMASRCIVASSSECNFSVRYVFEGSVGGKRMYSSFGTLDYNTHALFPVVTLSYEFIKVGTDGSFEIQLEE